MQICILIFLSFVWHYMKLYLLVIKLDNNGVHNNIIENCGRLQLLVHLGTITILEVEN